MWRDIRSLWQVEALPEEQYRAARAKILEKMPVPAFWLLGKTGSGKTSVIRYLTGAEKLEIGNGFQPQTRFSQRYVFPSEDQPLLCFLDTRGLGEASYDPAEDLAQFDKEAHLLVVTVRVMDHALESVVEPLRKIRQARPERPVVLVLTCLHQAYPQQQHPPAELLDDPLAHDQLPIELRKSIERQQERFGQLVDRTIPVDLTEVSDGFADVNYRGDRLKEALVDLLPAAYRQALLSLSDTMSSLQDLTERRAMPYILSYSRMTASAAAVPVPWVDVPLVVAIQSHLIYRLAGIYGQQMNAQLLGQMAGAVGGRLLTRLMIRGALKVVPVVGVPANMALAYGYTFGLGKACCWYFAQRRRGHVPTEAELAQVWKEQLAVASRLWKSTAP